MAFEPAELEEMLSNTDSLINQVYWFEQEIDKPKAASHRGVAINYVDLKERREEFLRELRGTILSWVYSKGKYKSIYDEELKKRNGDHQNTNAYLMEVVSQKFRKGHPQGQFGELLLYNFIQSFFFAPPLLRKMPLTTNEQLERNGADAIHYYSDGTNDVFILGESKCYKSNYKFNQALEESVTSIVNSFNKIDDEMLLYIYEDFCDPALTEKAKEFREAKCENVRYELVCLVAYNETKDVDDESEEAIKKKIENCLVERWKSSSDSLYDGVRDSLIKRMHYIVFPIWKLDELLTAF